MAGHSQFKNIMHRKGAQDKKRAKIFTKIIREIEVSVKQGSPDPVSNPRLRSAIAEARENNMPKDNIERAIKKGQGSANNENYEEIRYEGYAPFGVSVIVEALTDNRNRTASEVRSLFSKAGGSLGESGSVQFLFDKLGFIVYESTKISFDKLFEVAIELGAEDVQDNADEYSVVTTPDNLHAIGSELNVKLSSEYKSAKIDWQPKATIELDYEQALSVLKLINSLEDLDDVQRVFTNFEISEEILEKINL
jgi:YebC/PmpR family DNA-binding regulatory protein